MGRGRLLAACRYSLRSGKGKAMNDMITLGEFIVRQQADFPEATGELTQLLAAIRLAAKVVNREVNKAGLADIIGANGNTNVQGESQQKLDLYANEKFKAALAARGEVCGLASEEEEEFVAFAGERNKQAKYVVLIDPLDGSSNIDVNVSIGTIFSIYKRISPRGGPVQLADFLQPGRDQVAAGYVIYGSSTMLVFTTGAGVHGFTYDPSVGVFALSHPNIRTPHDGAIYSINEGNYHRFPQGIKTYIKHCEAEEPEQGRPYTARYIGSLVADFHRNLIKGGIYLYPPTAKDPQGKLRLLYEANPLALLVEQAGGMASDGVRRILDIKPDALHQRSPLYIGSVAMVEEVKRCLHDAAN